MQISIWEKGLMVVTVILFFGMGVFPNVNGNMIIKKNSQIIFNTQINYDHTIESSYFPAKTFVLGRLDSLNFNESEHWYAFTYDELRELYFFFLGQYS